MTNVSKINKNETDNKLLLFSSLFIVIGAGSFFIYKDFKKSQKLYWQNKIIHTAKKYIGQKEIPVNQGFEDKRFLAKMQSVGFNKGMQWCNLFVRLVFSETFKNNSEYYDKLIGNNLNWFKSDYKSLVTSLCTLTFSKFKKDKSNLFEVSSKPSVGALVIWESKTKPGSGHIGIVVFHAIDYMITIEGNANDDIVKLKDYKKLKKDKINIDDVKIEDNNDGSVQYCLRDLTGSGMNLLGFISLK